MTISIAVMLSSCEKLQDGVVNVIEFPEHEPRLAVTMFVSQGDTVLFATVYQSAGVTDSIGKHSEARFFVVDARKYGPCDGNSTHWSDPDPWNAWNSGP